MIDLSVGVSGSGKSTGMRAMVRSHIVKHADGVIAPDYERDWTDHDQEGNPTVPKSIAKYVVIVDNVDAAILQLEKKKKRLAIIRPVKETDYDLQHRIMTCYVAARWVMASPGRGLAITEAHRIFPNGKPLTGAFDRLITAWRHAGIGLKRGEAFVWLDTQRLSLLNRTVTEQATMLRLYAISGNLDLKTVREIGGKDLEQKVRECATRLVEGEPGYHVPLTAHRLPPYEVERFAI